MAWGWPGASRPEPVSNTELGFLLDPTVEQLILALYQQVTSSAGHFFVESVLVLAIAYLLFQKSYKPKEKDALSAQEIDELCEEWQPEALVTAEALASVVKRSDRVVTAQSGSRVTVDGKQVVNFASFDFLDFLSEESIKDDCERTIRKYGVGSCGPRGFYGTVDVHLQLEDELAKFVGTEGGIIYSYDAATASSIIPAFLKRGDLIIRDEALSYAVQAGIELSRAYVKEFRHNDVSDLENILEIVAEADRQKPPKEINRRFIIVEGLYQNTGMVCPLPEIVELATQYKYRVLLEESMSLGVLGATGRGACEHHGIQTADISIICGSMSTTLASVGGFACADATITAHQRLSSAGYCFSASLPPFNATAASSALALLQANPDRISKLRANAVALHTLLRDMTASLDKNASDSLWLLGDDISPIKHLHLQKGKGSRQRDEDTLHRICDFVLQVPLLGHASRLCVCARDRLERFQVSLWRSWVRMAARLEKLSRSAVIEVAIASVHDSTVLAGRPHASGALLLNCGVDTVWTLST